MFTIGTLAGIEIWDCVAKKPDISCLSPKVKEVMKSFIVAVPDILKNLLQQRATLETVMKARLMFLNHCLYFNYASKILEAKPDSSYGYFSREEIYSAIESFIFSGIELAEKVVRDPEAFLKNQNTTELEIMKNPGGLGLQPGLLKNYICGTLTIAELLKTQPEVIVEIGW